MIDPAAATSDRLRKELIERARREGKWIHLAYQNLWFSPDELSRENERGSWRLHPMNFTLRDPTEELARLEADVLSAEAAVVCFRNRLRAVA